MPHSAIESIRTSQAQRKRQRDSRWRQTATATTAGTRKSRLSGHLFFHVLVLIFLSNWMLVGAQETPNAALAIPGLTYPTNGSFRTNFCHAARTGYESDQSLEGVLEGVQLKVALYPNIGGYALFENDENGRPVRLQSDYAGLIPSMLDAICDRAHCTWRNSYVIVPLTLRRNQTLTDWLVWSTDVYDIAALFWLPSVERLQAGVTFVEPWFNGNIIMVAPKVPLGEQILDPWGWLTPFDGAVWILILATLIFSTLVHWMIQVVLVDPTSSTNHGESWNQFNWWEGVWQFATAFTGQFEFAPDSGPAYLFTFSVAFWALLMGASYTANLASFLVIHNQPPRPVNSVEEAILRNNRLCVRQGTILHALVQRHFPQYAASTKLVPIQGQPVQGLNDQVCDIALVTAGAWDNVQNNARLNGQCQLEWIGRPWQSVPGSFALRSDAGSSCTSLLRDALNLYLVELELEGVRDRVWQEHIDYQATVDCSSGTPKVVARGKQQRQRRQLEEEEEGMLSQFEKEAIREDLLFLDDDRPRRRLPEESSQLPGQQQQKHQQPLFFAKKSSEDNPITAGAQLWYRERGESLQHRDSNLELMDFSASSLSHHWSIEKNDNSQYHDVVVNRELQTSSSSVRSVDSAVANGSAAATSSKLSLTNMGGVFLLHGVLSLVAVVLAAVTWFRHHQKHHHYEKTRKVGDTTAGGAVAKRRTDNEKEEEEDKMAAPTMPCSKSSSSLSTSMITSTNQNDLPSALLVPRYNPHSNSTKKQAQKAVQGQIENNHTVAVLKAFKAELLAQLETTMDGQIKALLHQTRDVLDEDDEIIVPRSVPRLNFGHTREEKTYAPAAPCDGSRADNRGTRIAI